MVGAGLVCLQGGMVAICIIDGLRADCSDG